MIGAADFVIIMSFKYIRKMFLESSKYRPTLNACDVNFRIVRNIKICVFEYAREYALQIKNFFGIFEILIDEDI